MLMIMRSNKRYFLTTASSYLPKKIHWAKLKNKKWGSDYALENFDEFYKPLYGQKWASIRLALLSQQKYCAIVNNFSDVDQTESILQEIGAQNIRTVFNSRLKHALRITDSNCDKNTEDVHEEELLEVPTDSSDISEEETGLDDDSHSRFAASATYQTSKFNEFMPATRLKGLEEWVDESDYLAKLSQDNIPESNFCIVKDKPTTLPEQWKIYCYKRGVVNTFPNPRMSGLNVFAYYLMDASSILPVFALNPKSGDSILDMCAAPGGKTLAILQTLRDVTLVCNDDEMSRMKRLNNVLQAYVPSIETDLHKPSIIVADGRKFAEHTGVYNKILVDVPCTTDRLSANERSNNIFKPTRLKERVHLPELQTELLSAALKAVKPGGTVVYSTCSLSPIQNDGVVHMALRKMQETSSSKFVIHDLSQSFRPFSFLFAFHPSPKYGQLVIPFLPCNFGPMYVCKLSKL